MMSITLIMFSHLSAHAAVTLYSETFNQTGALGSTTWRGYYDTNAKTLNSTDGTADLFYRGHINNSAVNWTQNPTYLYAQSHGTTATPTVAMDYFLHDSVNLPSFTPLEYTNLTATWANYGNASDTHHRLAILVNTQWYVSSTTFGGGIATTNSTLNLGNTTWQQLTLNPGVALAIQPASINASELFVENAVIKNVGFYISNGATDNYITQRIGDLYITADLVPEPTKVGLCAFAFCGLLLQRRRHPNSPQV
jgi:hypothetical protein